MIRGAAQHMAYHAGQIALLKKLATARGTDPASQWMPSPFHGRDE
jgi:hypothetical protein